MNTENLKARLECLRDAECLPAKVVEGFASFLSSAKDEDLFRMSPLRYAAAAGIGEVEAIDLFLHATHAGVLEFSWGILCPACCAFLTTPGGLKHIAGRHCGFCQISVDSRLDDNVEVGFTVAPAIRRIRFHDQESLDMHKEGLSLFFSPSLPKDACMTKLLAANLIFAGRLERGLATEINAELPAGRYVLLAPASHSVLHLDAFAEGPSRLSVDFMDGRAIPARAKVKAGRVTLSVSNKMSSTAGAILFPDPAPPPEERPPGLKPPSAGLKPFLTGKRLINSQTFRDLFRAQSIPSEGGLELKSLTVLFTDLKRSTDMYERIGDLQAFDLVRQHFTVLRDVVAKEGGAIVKTIGDAIMASFPEPQNAVKAAAAMNTGVAAVAPELALKIGMHAGPCIAVELNDRLDYFGRTVNIAARVQGLAGEREIVCTEQVFDSPGVAEFCESAGFHQRRGQENLKGISGATKVVRLNA